MRGNPGCQYAHLAGWPGGYSVDYGRVRHVHISLDQDGGKEWGVHFRHGGVKRHRLTHSITPATADSRVPGRPR
jgi:hypothetical protein